MHAAGTFHVVGFTPTSVEPTPAVVTGLPVGVSTIEKTYDGAIVGRSSCVFTAAYDQAAGVGTYVAMEAFEGSVDGRSGAFVYLHSAATRGDDRHDEFFRIVASSGVGDLAGITGDGGLAVDADGTHRIWFDYELGDATA